MYKRQRLCIPTGILRTCERFHREAIGVLYGCNTFLYRLRDRLPCVTDVDQVALIDDDATALPTTTNNDNDNSEDDAGGDNDDDADPEPDDVNDPDWQEETPASRSRSRAQHARRTRPSSKRPPITDPDINVDKNLHLFRRLIIEAEKNRFAQGTRRLMASAIEAFAFASSPSSSSSRCTNIQTLTIRVAPQWDAASGPDGYGSFTFVDFFSSQSAVIRAIENVNCQFLRLVKRVEVEGEDEWDGDVAMQEERRRKAGVAEGALRCLDGHVQRFCEKFLSQKTWDKEAWDAIDFGVGDDPDAWEGDY